jgi:ADP-heptose:LPS heptosyltransferase
MLHVAAALHHPTITLFGPTDPRARVNYHPEAVAIWGGAGLKNYPAWYTDPGDGWMCWRRLEERLIIQVTLAMLDKKPLPEALELVHFGNCEKENTFYQVV